MAGLPRFNVPSYGARGGPLRYPKGRTGESQYDREERLKLEMQMRLKEEYLGGRGEMGRQREENMRMEQKIKAEGWEQQYTAKQRMDMSQDEAAYQAAMKNPIFSPEEKEMITRKFRQQFLDNSPTVVPPDPRKPRAPGGREFGVPFMDDDGATVQYIMGSNGQVEAKLIQRYDQGPEHHKMETQRTWEKERGELRLELMREEVEVPSKGDKPPTKKKKYENWEIEELLNAGGYSSANAPLPQGGAQTLAPSQPQQPQVPQAQPAPARPPVVRPQGMEPLVRTSKVKEYVDNIQKKYPNIKDMPTNELRKLKRAREILRSRK